LTWLTWLTTPFFWTARRKENKAFSGPQSSGAVCGWKSSVAASKYSLSNEPTV
jgi:hypothetical protein